MTQSLVVHAAGRNTDDRQVATAIVTVKLTKDRIAGITVDLDVWLGTWRAALPSSSRLDARRPVRRWPRMVHFVGRFAAKGRERAVLTSSDVGRHGNTANPIDRFVPATHGPQLQDGHSFHGWGRRPSLWRDSRLHASPVDSQFLAEHGNFGFELMNPGSMDIAILDQRFTASEHGDSYKADDIEHGIPNIGVPVLRKRQ